MATIRIQNIYFNMYYVDHLELKLLPKFKTTAINKKKETVIYMHTAFWRIVWLHDDFHVNLTEFFFVKWDHYWGWTLAYLLGCISFP